MMIAPNSLARQTEVNQGEEEEEEEEEETEDQRKGCQTGTPTLGADAPTGPSLVQSKKSFGTYNIWFLSDIIEWNLIVFTGFNLILNQTEFCLTRNQTVNTIILPTIQNYKAFRHVETLYQT